MKWARVKWAVINSVGAWCLAVLALAAVGAVLVLIGRLGVALGWVLPGW